MSYSRLALVLALPLAIQTTARAEEPTPAADLTTAATIAPVVTPVVEAVVAEDDGDEAAEEEEAPAAGSMWVGSAGFVGTNAYIFRGINQQTTGAIFQPWAELGLNLYSGDSGLTALQLAAGTWASLHLDPDAAGASGPKRHYETDYYVALRSTFAGAVGLQAMYLGYTSPNGKFATTHEFDVILNVADGVWLSEKTNGIFTGVNPKIIAAFEISGQADGGTGEGIYIEPSIYPSVTAVSSDKATLGFAVPVIAGLSASKYYESAGVDSTFGYLETGLDMSLGLGFIPAQAGAWSVVGGFHAIVHGPNTTVDKGTDLMGRGGLAVAF